ncbi:hypothetical protein [Natroniella acetigena]|nr:hypothetical protein [Natroniella acetigena]
MVLNGESMALKTYGHMALESRVEKVLLNGSVVVDNGKVID